MQYAPRPAVTYLDAHNENFKIMGNRSPNENRTGSRDKELLGSGRLRRNEDRPYRPPSAQGIVSPAFSSNSKRGEIVHDRSLQEDAHVKTILELKNKLNDKEIELLDLRNEKMKLEMVAEAGKKELREKAKEVEELKLILRQEGGHLNCDPAAEDYNARVQRILRAQQETNAEAMFKLKEKASFLGYYLS